MMECVFCKKKFKAKPSWIKSGRRKYCSAYCKYAAVKKGEVIPCYTCGKLTYRVKSTRKIHTFCSHSCSAKWSNSLRIVEKHPLYSGGKGSYRKRAVEKYGFICSSGTNCPLSDKILPDMMYEVDHIDGDRENNKIENLRVLCVWCHRLTPTFGNKNKCRVE